MIDDDTFDRFQTANHEAGHAFIAWRLGRYGEARLYSHRRPGPNDVPGEFHQLTRVDAVTAVAGFVAENVFHPFTPIADAKTIVCNWRETESLSRSVKELPAADLIEVEREAIIRRETDPNFDRLAALIERHPAVATPSKGDLDGLPKSWDRRRALVSQAVDLLTEGAELFRWFRDGLLEYSVIRTDVLDHWIERASDAPGLIELQQEEAGLCHKSFLS